jgi:CubicO group peptidase (beta-lactamase class C family)
MVLASHRRRCLSLLALGALSACVAGPSAAPPATLLAAAIAPDYNGVVMVRARRGAVPLLGAYGQARFDAPCPVLPDTRFMVGSVSKWITAVAVLRLVEQGRLDLDKPVTTWLPELPAASRAVTLRALLSNTSGIENGLGLAMKRDRSPTGMRISPLEGALKFGSGPVIFPPGSNFDYSVTNWLLVGGIVERATGEPFTSVVTRLVFEPAGVRDTGFVDHDSSAPRLAIAYDASKAARKVTPSPPMVAASGTIYSTASDLVKLADAVYGDALLSSTSRKELLTVRYAAEEYALGGRVKQRAGRALAWETGVSGGYKTLLAYAPDSGRAVVLLNNTDMQQSEQARIGLALLDAMSAMDN